MRSVLFVPHMVVQRRFTRGGNGSLRARQELPCHRLGTVHGVEVAVQVEHIDAG